MRVLVTGCSGYLGARLLEKLHRSPDVEEIIGIDEHQPLEYFNKLTFYQQSVTQPYEHYFENVDAAVHLAFAFRPMRDDPWVERINLEGAERFLRGLIQHQVPHGILVSSATVYGARPDNDVPLSESSLLRPEPHFYEARDKLRIEALSQSFKDPKVKLKILRPSIVTGPHARHFWMQYFSRPWVPTLQGFNPPMQLLHEEDLADLMVLLCKTGSEGIYNVAGEGTLYLHDVIETIGGKPIPVPKWMLSRTVDLMWRYRLGHLKDLPPGILPYLSHPWIVDTSKLKKVLDWHPKYDTVQSLLAFKEAKPPVF